jgi:hypothetical protein
MKSVGVIPDSCDYCDTKEGLKRCEACKVARYCSVEHQRLAWKAGHKDLCKLSKLKPVEYLWAEFNEGLHKILDRFKYPAEYHTLLDDESKTYKEIVTEIGEALPQHALAAFLSENFGLQ